MLKRKKIMFDWPKLKSTKKIKPLGGTSPWVWVVEPSYGCNLKCGHCCAELIDENKKEFMSYDNWSSTFKIMIEVSPTVRVDICGIVGEPTLHPNLTEWLSIARYYAPNVQIQITTNGTMIKKGNVNFKDLLDAGANVIYTDQYGDHKNFEELARQSGYRYYSYYNKPKGAWSPWKYYGAQLKMIVLMDEPSTWPDTRYKAGLLGHWYGNLNWEKAKRFKMKPLEKPLIRRCNQPFLYVNVAANGNYLLCCQDGMQITNGMFGGVYSGVNGFLDFWYGKEMQIVRRRLRNKDRASTKYACAKCNITFSRCDFRHWTQEELSIYRTNNEWVMFNDNYIAS